MPFLPGVRLPIRSDRGTGNSIKGQSPSQVQLFDNQFDETEHELRLIWPVTGKSSIDARVGPFRP